MEDVMYDPPVYIWAITIAGPIAIAAAKMGVATGLDQGGRYGNL
jgi:hypothetical protein